MAAIPEFAPKGEDHLLRSTSVVRHVNYGRMQIEYTTFDAPAVEVLRLAARPKRVVVGGKDLANAEDAANEGYTIKPMPGGDVVVRVHRRSSNAVTLVLSE